MELGSSIYILDDEVDGGVPDLNHLEKALNDWNYKTTPSLKFVQSGETSFAKISWLKEPTADEGRANPSQCIIGHSFISKDEKGYRVVVSPRARRLEEFMDKYEPVALEQ